MWGRWENWSDCSETCGGGEKNRTRRCDSPVPDHGGKDCVGNSTETIECNKNKCKLSGNNTRDRLHVVSVYQSDMM